MADDPLHTGSGSRPIPDPTLLTGQLVDKAVEGMREILTSELSGQTNTLRAELDGQRRVFETRMDANDKATRILQDIADKMVMTIDGRIAGLKELHEEKFRGIEAQLINWEHLRIEAKADAKVGIDAALASAEKLVGQSNDSFRDLFDKTATSTEKLLDKQEKNQETTSQGLDDKIAGLKERLDRIEGAAVGIVTQKNEAATTTTTTGQANSFMLALFVAGISLVGLILLVIRDFAR